MKSQFPVTLTLLPPPEDRRGEVEIVEEWARGLDWVRGGKPDLTVGDIVEAASFLLSDRCPTMTGETVNASRSKSIRLPASTAGGAAPSSRRP